jgi:ORF6N domain
MPSPQELAQLVFFVRGEKVMFDADLAKLYGVETRVLLQAVKRNRPRFPEDFAFQLKADELTRFEITSCDLKQKARGRGHALKRATQLACGGHKDRGLRP